MARKTNVICDLSKLLHNISKQLEVKDLKYLKHFASPPLYPSEIETCENIFFLLTKLKNKECITEENLGWLHVALRELDNKPALDLLFEYEIKRNIGQYKVMLYRVAKQIGNGIFEQLKLLSGLDESVCDEVSIPLELFAALEHRGTLSEENVESLIELLTQVEETKLAKVVIKYKERLNRDNTAHCQKVMPTSQNELPCIPSRIGHTSISPVMNSPNQCNETPGQSFSTKGQKSYDSVKNKVNCQPSMTRGISERSTLQVKNTNQLEDTNHNINNKPNIPDFSLLSIHAEQTNSRDDTFPKTMETRCDQLQSSIKNFYIPKGKQEDTAGDDSMNVLKVGARQLHTDSPGMISMTTQRNPNDLHCLGDEVKSGQPTLSPSQKITCQLLERRNGAGDKKCQQSQGAAIPVSQSSLTSKETVYTIHCVKCGCQLCTPADLRLHYSKAIVTGNDYRDKVILKEKVNPTETRPGYTVCKNCCQQLGPQFNHENAIYLCLSPSNIKLKCPSTGEYSSVEKWTCAPFSIKKLNKSHSLSYDIPNYN